MQIWIHDNKMKKIVALNNDIPDMMSYTNSSWHSYLDQATSTFDFTIPKFSNGELHEDLKLINDECFVSFYVNGSYQVFYIATLQEDDFNIQLTCNNTNLEYALEYANPFNSSSAQSIQWYLEHMDLLSFAAVEIGNNEISDRKRTLTFDSQETKMNRLQSLMSNFDAEFEFKVELNRDGTYKRIVINIYQEADDTHHGIGTDRKDVVLYYSNGLKGVQVTSDKTQMFNAGVFDGKDGVNLANVEFSEKNADGVEEFYSRKGDIFVYAPLSMQRYPATMKPDGQDNWIRKDFQTEYENVNDLKAYALRTLKQYAYPLITYTASVQSGFVSHYTDLKLGDTIRIIDKNFVGGLALEARVSEMIISFDNPANNSFVFTNYRKLDNKPSSALQTRIEQAVESKLPYRIELATTGGVTFKNNEGETIVKPSLYKGNLPWTKDVTWHWTLNSIVTDGMQYRIQARDITDTAVLTVDAFVGGNKVATTEITLTNVNDGPQGPQGPQGDEGPKGDKGDTGNGIANTVITYGLSVSDTTEPATWSSSVPTLVKGMYLRTRTVIIYTNGESTTSYQISYIAKDADATAAIDKTKQELLEKLDTVRNDSLAAVEEAKQELSTVADDLSKAKTDFQNAVSEVDTKATNLQSDVSNLNTSLSNTAKVLQTQGTTLANQAKELQTQASQLTEQAKAQETLTTRVENVETTANGTKTTVSELSKTVTQNGKDITSVSNRTKTVETSLTSAKTSISELQTSVSTAQTDLTNLTKRTKTVEDGLTGTKTNLSELTQTVSNDGKTIASLTSRTKTVEDSVSGLKTTMSSVQKDLTAVTTRTKTVEDDLSGTKTTLSQVQTTANSASQKTATLETGLNGLTAKFDNLKIGAVNLLHNSKGPFQPKGSRIDNYVTYSNAWINMEKGKEYTLSAKGTAPFTSKHATDQEKNEICLWLVKHDENINVDRIISNATTGTAGTKFTWNDPSGKYRLRVNTYKVDNSNYAEEVQIEEGNLRSTYSQNESDIESKVAEYKQTSDQNYASLQTTVQNLDGTVQQNKTVAEQTAAGFKTRIESLETYKSGESTRANQYFESAKTETARQLTAERTAIAKDYVAKSTYTSDVTGIRNDLTATTTTANTTKTNLANYQASNDKAVANLQSNLQTANGNISSLKTKVEAVPGQITSAVSAVEGKIPTNVSTRNLILKSNDLANPHKQNGANTTVTSTDDYFVIKSTGYTANAWGGISWNMSISEMKAGEQFSILMPVYIDSSISLDNGWSFNIKNHSSNSFAYDYSIPTNKKDQWFNVAITFKAYNNVVFDTYPFYVYLVKNGLVRIKPPMLVRGNLIPSDYQPAFEDTKSDVTKLNTTLTQTANGLEQLSTQVTSQGSTITSHTNSINSLSTGLSAKVSQTDFNTLSGRVTTAENNITAKANELSSKISSLNVGGKNYLPTSRVINRGCSNFSYSNTSKSWTMTVPASSTTFGNGITFNTNSLNILLNGGETLFFGLMIKANKACSFNYDINNALSGIASNDNDDRSKQAWSPSNKSIPANVWTRVWFSYTAKANVPITEANSNFGIVNNTEAITVEIKEVMVAKSNVPVDYQTPDADFEAKDSELKQTTDSIKASVSSLDKSTVKSASLTINTDGIVMKAGKSTTDVANAIGSYFAVNQNAINLFSDKINVKGSMIVEGAITSNKIASKSINTAHLNGKIITADVIATGAITANAIKAGAVTTDKMTANSINGDRITAGTLDAAKIKAGSITASQIASGTITSAQIKTGTISAANIAAGAITTDKIAANSINSSKIVSSGITANVIKGGKLQSLSNATNFELDTGKLFYNNNNTGIFRVQANASTMGLKFSNTSITVSGTSRILSRVILGGDRRETSLDDGKWDQGGFTGIVAETINGVDSNAHSQADTLRVIGDNIYFTHSYNYDAQTKTSAQGWKMETFSPFSSYAGNVVLKPYGINYRQSDIITGDVRLDNGDGSGYWVRGCIRTLRNCFQHYLNGGTTSGAMNAIRDALKEISGV